MKRRGYQAAYGARSTNHNLTRWNEFIIDVDFQTICRDEGASSQRVLNICSTLRFCDMPQDLEQAVLRLHSEYNKPNVQYLDDLQAQCVMINILE